MGYSQRLTRTALLILLCLFPQAASARAITLTAVGDIMLAGSATPFLEKKGYDHPFSATRSILGNSHIAIGNLESPITGRGVEFSDKRFRFRTRPEAARALKEAGFTILTLANNHILDFGTAGLGDTLFHLESNSIGYCGAGRNLADARTPAIVTAQGVRVAFLAYSLTYPAEFFAGTGRHGTAPGYAPFVAEDIRSARKRADHVVVSFHWGRELDRNPRPYQVTAARRAIDAGADLVLGHHPHVLQGVERYRNGLIFYSLGNFAFGSRSVAADRSMIARITLDRGVKGAEIIPLNVLNREVGFRPVPINGKKGGEVVGQLNDLSRGRGVRIALEAGRYLVKWDEGRLSSP